jgi:hypothetical protein
VRATVRVRAATLKRARERMLERLSEVRPGELAVMGHGDGNGHKPQNVIS